MESWLIVKTPPGDNCEENDGIPTGLFAVTRAEWDGLLRRVAEAESPTLVRDCSGGGHGCVLMDNLSALLAGAQVVRTNPAAELLDFVREVGDDTLLDELRDWAAEQGTVVYVVCECCSKPRAFASYQEAQDAAQELESVHKVPVQTRQRQQANKRDSSSDESSHILAMATRSAKIMQK